MNSLALHSQITAGARALAMALGERDMYTHSHSRRVVDVAYQLGLVCALDYDSMDALGVSAYFHDVGKIGIPDHILLKPGRYTRDEMEVMKEHPVKGEGILRELDLISADTIALAVRHHHEHFSGRGYPDGLRGEAIPVISRIISVADSYDALTDDRPYHKGRDVHETLDIMAREAGEKLDPYLVGKLNGLVESGILRGI